MKQQHFSSVAYTTAFYGLLGALAIVLSAVENMIPPIPMLPPGAKLGLSNLVTMFAVNTLGFMPALFVTLLKGLFAGLTRGVLAAAMSLSGGLVSTLVMWLLCKPKKRLFGAVGFGVAGAVAHNFGQFWMAFFLTTPAVIYYIPWLLLFGVLSGILTGLVFCVTMPLLYRYFPEHSPGKTGGK